MRASHEPKPYEASMIRRRRHVLPLPEHDPIIDAMDRDLRDRVARTWQRRAHEELKVAAEFSVLCRELLETCAGPEVLAKVSRAVSDEVRHAEVLRTLASRYASAEIPWPTDEVLYERPSSKADARLSAAFHTVAMCCVNEAVASAFLERSLADATSPSARVAVGDLLADEVLHARVGWTFLASQPKALRDAVEANQLTLVRPVVECWWEQGRVTLPEGAPEHGIPSMRTVRACTLAAMRDVVLPGFASLGIDVSPTVAWLAERDATP